MSTIEILAAGAGSGKTRELAQILEKAVREEGVRSHAVLATTFTNKAAAELHARVRTRLLAAGLSDAAQQLGAARIGTVNSVCGRIVSECAFELGVSPRVEVLDETASKVALAQAISEVAGAGRAATAATLAERLGSRDEPWDWRADVRRVVDLARSNAIAVQGFQACAARSIAGFEELLEQPRESAETLDLAFVCALRGFVEGVDRAVDTTKATAEALTRAEAALRRMDAGSTLRWSEWTALATSAMTPGKKSDPLASPVREAAKAFHRHPRLREDVRAAIEFVFDLSGDVLGAYERHKRARGVIDFTDQEVLALRALAIPEVAARLREDLDLVLVDEFQDTSPIQLRIFLAVAKLARRSVWVGDQKQAIYGFRGTDPALMDAAIEAILSGEEPKTLRESWRSRPELVRLTSDVFVPPFAAQGISASRVRLEPRDATEPAGLGAIVERWNLDAKNKDVEAKAVAAGVAQLLADPAVLIRDGAAGPRRPRPADVAVLCLANDHCAKVAGALAALGIPAAIATSGLLATPEARLLCAGLALWCDVDDRLALATIGRLVGFAPDGDAWLDAMLDPTWSEAFAKLPAAARLRTSRDELPNAGALAAFDVVAGALELRGQCLTWGSSEARLANIEALRAHAVAYATAAAAAGSACTPAGLLAWYGDLAAEELDERAPLPGEAVVVGTWHGAKGLEWPIVVLTELSKKRLASPLGVSIRTDTAKVDLADPLAGRWIRYWPQPFDARQTKHAFATVVDGHAATQEARAQRQREDLRLLYVGWTRAKDRVVLADRAGKLSDGILSLLTDAEGQWLLTDADPTPTWAGRRVDLLGRDVAPSADDPVPPEPGEGYVVAGPREHPPATLRPSDLAGVGKVADVQEIGKRLPLNGSPDMADLGSAVHGFLAADQPGLSPEVRRELADGLLRRWGVRSALEPEHLLQASDALRAWIERRWCGARWCREWAIARRLVGGSVLRGRIDLMLDTGEGLVVIDHKVYPGRADEAIERSGGHGGQLLAYAAAVEAATRRPVLGVYVHLAILGAVVEVRGSEPTSNT